MGVTFGNNKLLVILMNFFAVFCLEKWPFLHQFLPEPKKKFNKRAQNIKYEGEKQNTLESIPSLIPLSRSQDRR